MSGFSGALMQPNQQTNVTNVLLFAILFVVMTPCILLVLGFAGCSLACKSVDSATREAIKAGNDRAAKEEQAQSISAPIKEYTLSEIKYHLTRRGHQINNRLTDHERDEIKMANEILSKEEIFQFASESEFFKCDDRVLVILVFSFKNDRIKKDYQSLKKKPDYSDQLFANFFVTFGQGREDYKNRLIESFRLLD